MDRGRRLLRTIATPALLAGGVVLTRLAVGRTLHERAEAGPGRGDRQ